MGTSTRSTARVICCIVLLLLPAIAGSGTAGNGYHEQEWVHRILVTKYGVHRHDAFLLSDAIHTASRETGVDTATIMAVIQVESSFDHTAVSKRNAVGYMQVRKTVWGSICPYNVMDKYENILCGAWILKQYRIKLGSMAKAIPAYNVGITAYRNGIMPAASARYSSKIKKELALIRGK